MLPRCRRRVLRLPRARIGLDADQLRPSTTTRPPSAEAGSSIRRGIDSPVTLISSTVAYNLAAAQPGTRRPRRWGRRHLQPERGRRVASVTATGSTDPWQLRPHLERRRHPEYGRRRLRTLYRWPRPLCRRKANAEPEPGRVRRRDLQQRRRRRHHRRRRREHRPQRCLDRRRRHLQRMQRHDQRAPRCGDHAQQPQQHRQRPNQLRRLTHSTQRSRACTASPGVTLLSRRGRDSGPSVRSSPKTTIRNRRTT